MNSWTIKNQYLLPLILSLINRLQDCTLFTGFNIEWGYNKVLIKPEDQWKAALTIIDHGCSQAAIFLPCQKSITGLQIAQLYYKHLYP